MLPVFDKIQSLLTFFLKQCIMQLQKEANETPAFVFIFMGKERADPPALRKHMIKENQKFLNFINVLIDAILILAAVIPAFLIRFYVMHGMVNEPFSSYLYVAAADIPIQLILFSVFGLYEPHRKKRIYTELRNMVIATVISYALLNTALFLIKGMDFSRIALFLFFVIKNVLLGAKRVALRLILRKIRKSGMNQKHILLVGSNVMARNCYEEICRSPELGYIVRGYVSDSDSWKEVKWLGSFGDLEQVIAKINPDEIIASLDGEEYSYLEMIIYQCEKNGIRFSFIPYYSQFMSENTQIDSLNGIPLLNLRKIPLDYVGNAILKRAMDIVGSALLILLTSPVMLVVAIGVKLSSPGPIIFKQMRVGYGKKPFAMYKFRSMRVNTQENTGWTTDADPRKTKFGSFIRKYSLDELPQFFNVLKGDMSLVGPRPEIGHFVEQFRDEIPLYMVRHQVRPGITGWAQVNGLRGDTSISERVKYDRWYISNWSVGLDISILLRTVFGGFKNNEVLVASGSREKK